MGAVPWSNTNIFLFSPKCCEVAQKQHPVSAETSRGSF